MLVPHSNNRRILDVLVGRVLVFELPHNERRFMLQPCACGSFHVLEASGWLPVSLKYLQSEGLYIETYG